MDLKKIAEEIREIISEKQKDKKYRCDEGRNDVIELHFSLPLFWFY